MEEEAAQELKTEIMKPLTTATAKSHSEKRVKKENIKTETKIKTEPSTDSVKMSSGK